MKKNLFALLLVVAVVCAFAPRSLSLPAQDHEHRHSTSATTHATANSGTDSDDSDFQEKDEFHQSYQLASAAKVEVRGINGTVDIETGAGSTAEVNVVRSARNRDDLEYRKVIVE